MVNDNIYSDIAMVNIETGETKNVANTNAGESDPQFSPDGKWIAYLVSEEPVVWGGKNWIDIVPVSGGPLKKLASTPNDLTNIIGWSQDGDHIYVGENNKTLFSIYSLATDGKGIEEWNKTNNEFLALPYLNMTSTHWGFILQSTSTPPEAFVSNSGNYLPVKISNINAEIAKQPVSKTELIKWKSFDGKEIEGLLTYPLNYQAGKKYPLILNVHGGPAGVFTQNFVAVNQTTYPIAAFAEMGIFVLRPNPCGSGGYG